MKTLDKGFNAIIENRIETTEMVAPSPERIAEFAAANKLEKKEFEKEISGAVFNVSAWYVNEDLCRVELSRNGATLYNLLSSGAQFKGVVSQIKNQLGINV